jgi:hypothetical protein
LANVIAELAELEPMAMPSLFLQKTTRHIQGGKWIISSSNSNVMYID